MKLASVVFMLGNAFGGDLSQKNAAVLVENIPEVVANRKSGGCPSLDRLGTVNNVADFQVRNLCPKKGSGLIGNYSVDLTTGAIWRNDNKDDLIDSPRLRRLKRVFMGRQKVT